jgi:Flp pilus assembly pilin Flp
VRATGARPSPSGTLEASRGQGIVEYGLLLGLTSALTVVWLVVFGGAIADALAIIGEAIDRATGG